jgi:hypothetical protein
VGGVEHGNRIHAVRPHRPRHVADGLLLTARDHPSGLDDLVQEDVLGPSPLVDGLVVERDGAVCGDELTGARVLVEQGLEFVCRRGIDHDVGCRARRMQAGWSAIEPLDAKEVAGPADVTQLECAVDLTPQRDDALLDDEDLVLVRLALRQDVLVPFMEPDSAVARECEHVAIVHRLKRGICLEEVSYAVADGGSFH